MRSFELHGYRRAHRSRCFLLGNLHSSSTACLQLVIQEQASPEDLDSANHGLNDGNRLHELHASLVVVMPEKASVNAVVIARFAKTVAFQLCRVVPNGSRC